jgi:hypothetical protein
MTYKEPKKNVDVTSVLIEFSLDNTENTHTLMDILDSVYTQYLTKDYLEGKYSNLKLKDSQGFSIGTIKICNEKV